MRVLALEPYYGGSHRAFLRGWSRRSRHDWTLWSLPARHWKWRMRHSAIAFAERLRAQVGELPWDAVLASDMLSLAEFKGLCGDRLSGCPCIVYFHESQMDYPDPHARPRDHHFGFTNLTSADAADAVWFNSRYHRARFLSASDALIDRMPDCHPREMLARIRSRSRIVPPGINGIGVAPRQPGPLRIAWVARWEQDKRPGVFLEALLRLKASGCHFELNMMGGHDPGDRFGEYRAALGESVRSWGFVEGDEAYTEVLRQSDVVVSTAVHEYFGLGVLEAVSAGALPLVPRALAYPEVLAGVEALTGGACWHDNTDAGVCLALKALAAMVAADGLPWDGPGLAACVARYDWSQRVTRMDDALEDVARPEKDNRV